MIEFLTGMLHLISLVGSLVTFVISGLFLLYPIIMTDKVDDTEARTCAMFSIAFMLFSLRLGMG